MFQIAEIYALETPVLYKLVDLKGDPFGGTYCKQQLLKTKKPEVYKVEKVLCKKKIKNKTFYKIKWLYYPNKFNSYEPAENIISGKQNGNSKVTVPNCRR